MVLLIAASVGCAAPVRRPPADTTLPSLVSEISEWHLQGRLALSNGRDGGSGQLSWHQADRRAELQFIGALGRGSWRLKVDDDLAELETAEHGVLQAPDVETLVSDRLGWQIPVDSLRYWVLGGLDPLRTGHDNFDRNGRLTYLRQAGWLVEYEGWIEVGDHWLPRKVTASQDGNRVRILVKNWRLPD
jgi:outer membrane lipoprotein LolB